MRAHGGGVAVQLASTAGLRGFAFTAAYTAAKHAMVGLTRALAVELAREPRLRVFAVCPGFVDTDITRRAADAIAARGRTSAADALAAMAAMNRIGRLHSAEEVGAAVARVVRERPEGCVLDLDQEPPAFVP
jgi:NAD(P)-dependent dehydrogenase (short-subunit alcohol dehydrogenase family)